jgi:hypothetical protein
MAAMDKNVLQIPGKYGDHAGRRAAVMQRSRLTSAGATAAFSF